MGRESLEFLAANLPPDEQIAWIASAPPNGYQAREFHCLHALTDRRLLFVAPAPRVLSWPFPSVTRIQSLDRTANQIQTFFVDDSGGGQCQLGTDGEWGPTFASHAKRAIAQATLRNA
jgi:hypothetical protein